MALLMVLEFLLVVLGFLLVVRDFSSGDAGILLVRVSVRWCWISSGGAGITAGGFSDSDATTTLHDVWWLHVDLLPG